MKHDATAMAKSKTPSPQEQYKARKAREEKERSALLPPGLVNHGNTCFMNSVLQALIATHYLQHSQHSLFASRPVEHALPIGDHLLAVLRSAWDIQNNRKRENLSPKDILAEVGKKYDQYLDFRQQDAHEFLCQLLDAIRMEEIDVIKQRSPPQATSTRRTRSHNDDKLLSFVDMIFGGKLASILVCQTCKHVSHTYEDFSDLSLSIKPEDYVRERKRDKLKQFAKKIGTAFYPAVPQQRSSSVPTTPIRDSNLDSPEPVDSLRRNSIDLADVDTVAQPVNVDQVVAKDDTALQVPPSPSPVADSPFPEVPTNTPHPVSVSDLAVPASGDHTFTISNEKSLLNGKERRDKDESWAKISRRITVSVGLAMRSKTDRKDRKVTPAATSLKHADDAGPSLLPTAESVNGTASPHLHLERESTPLGLVNEKLQAHLTNVKRSVTPTQRSGNSPLGSSAHRLSLISRPSSPGLHVKTSKPPRPPKLSTEEAAYLRDILADINPPNVQKPFSIFKQSKDPSSSSAFGSQNIFLKINQINKIEECLRLFTSVEVLDGDNTVRCHRCWKIANGLYKPRARASAQEPDSCSDSDDDDNGARSTSDPKTPYMTIPATNSSLAPSPSHSNTSIQDTHISRDTQSALTQSSSTYKHVPPALQLNDHHPIELVSPIKNEPSKVLAVPSASTPTPQSPQTAKPAPIRRNTGLTQASATTTEYSSRISLGAPSDQHRQREFRSGDSNTESEISEGESETLLSIYSDVSSVPSCNPSRSASQEHLHQSSSAPDEQRAKHKLHPSGVPRSRQFILRPAYKRYLIASPPPVLIVHLKRFQQLSKTPVVSFSTGFKKLDDYISFPEYLDLAPYLAPRREDYFDSKVAVARGRARRPTPCMYRLYTVVVHIGNMLGGHYIAYTALPPSPSDASGNEKQRSDNGTASRDWAFVSDTIVRLSSLEEVLKSRAYICMYERI